MDLLQYSEVESLLLNLVGDDLPETYRLLGSNDSRRRKWAILRGKAIEHLTNAAARAFVAQQEALLAGSLPGDLVEHMHGTAKRCVLDAKDMARKRMFQDKRKNLHEIGAYTSLEILLNAFCGATLEQHGGRTPSFKKPSHPRFAGQQCSRSILAITSLVYVHHRLYRRHDRQLGH